MFYPVFALHTWEMRRSVADIFDGTRRTCEPGAVKKICHRTLIPHVCKALANRLKKVLPKLVPG